MEIDKEKLKTLKELEKKGIIRIEEEYSVKCLLCKKEFKAKSEELLKETLKEHLDNKCEIAKFLKSFKPQTKMRDIGLFLELYKKLEKGKITETELKQFTELSTTILRGKT